MAVVQLFRREDAEPRGVRGDQPRAPDANLQAIFYYAVFYPAVELLAALAIALILVYGGGRCWRARSRSARWWPSSSTRSASGGRSRTSPRSTTCCSRRWRPPSGSSSCSTRSPGGEPGGAAAPAAVRGRVAFEGVLVRLRRGGPARTARRSIRGGAGEEVALVGATGAGKTSVISLLCASTTSQRARHGRRHDVRELGRPRAAPAIGAGAAGRVPVQRHDRVEHPARLRDPDRARARGGRGRVGAHASSRAAAGLRHGGDASAARRCRSARSSSSPSRARSPTTRACWSWTRPPPRSTPRRSS